jgi:hypothetical protein
MNFVGFLDDGDVPERPARPSRRDFARLACLALLCAGGGLALVAASQAPGVVVPKPGPRRYGPMYRNHAGAR